MKLWLPLYQKGNLSFDNEHKESINVTHFQTFFVVVLSFKSEAFTSVFTNSFLSVQQHFFLARSSFPSYESGDSND